MTYRKILLFFGALSISTTNLLVAHNASQPDSVYVSLDKQERKAYREITPDAGPRVAQGTDLFVTANFIWWRVSQDGLDYATNGFVSGGAPADAPFSNNAQKGYMQSVGKDWSPGFKVGLGMNLDHDGWDLYLKYAWLHANDSSSIAGKNVALVTFALSGGENGPLSRTTDGSAKSHWDLHFNVLDLELGRNFSLSQFLNMRPYIGLKGTWQCQNQTVRLFGNGFTVEVAEAQNNRLSVTGPFVTKQAQDTWGVGIRGGFNLSWLLSRSWSLYGDLSWTALMTSYHKLRRIDTLYDITTSGKQVTGNYDNPTTYHVNPIAELELGLRWDTYFANGDYHFLIQAGWEEQMWLSWLRPIELIDEVSHDLSFHGLNLKFRFDF
ncbi:MAG: autotransporter outer membrane beta-barrel domain-containing protein [Chlamydiia bacterium]|nr:autotransporter outer membrane beta-barrel domain-containing protein [Chlamydiia bacterium]